MKWISAMLLFLAASSVWADDFASAHDAEAMVKKAIQHIKSDGKDKVYSEITEKNPLFVDRDLYVTVYNFDGKVLAHGQNAKMVGKVLLDLKDPDGKEFVKERVDLAKSKPNFWQDYKFTDPVTKKVLPKSMYCERLDDTAVCAGIYKR